ncbi:MAG: hypothetical protein JAZ15_11850 [Candidatus Thiodiazotropha endolucinida]|nr:hypothetical protein [Candidatus Thiodiazotropha taylori]MCW4313715.1 hypothetical protein [Candidatus Thiodiazotropha taylori]
MSENYENFYNEHFLQSIRSGTFKSLKVSFFQDQRILYADRLANHYYQFWMYASDKKEKITIGYYPLLSFQAIHEAAERFFLTWKAPVVSRPTRRLNIRKEPRIPPQALTNTQLKLLPIGLFPLQHGLWFHRVEKSNVKCYFSVFSLSKRRKRIIIGHFLSQLTAKTALEHARLIEKKLAGKFIPNVKRTLVKEGLVCPPVDNKTYIPKGGPITEYNPSSPLPTIKEGFENYIHEAIHHRHCRPTTFSKMYSLPLTQLFFEEVGSKPITSLTDTTFCAAIKTINLKRSQSLVLLAGKPLTPSSILSLLKYCLAVYNEYSLYHYPFIQNLSRRYVMRALGLKTPISKHHPFLKLEDIVDYMTWLRKHPTGQAKNCMIWHMLTCGRPSEAREARWSYFNFKGNKLYFDLPGDQTKSGYGKSIFINSYMFTCLLKIYTYLLSTGEPRLINSDLVFPKLKKGKVVPVSRSEIHTKMVVPYKEMKNLNFTLHGFRSSCAGFLLRKNPRENHSIIRHNLGHHNLISDSSAAINAYLTEVPTEMTAVYNLRWANFLFGQKLEHQVIYDYDNLGDRCGCPVTMEMVVNSALKDKIKLPVTVEMDNDPFT